jgi:Reverse transcriptase (RNA-dependent DNA polymerase)
MELGDKFSNRMTATSQGSWATIRMGDVASGVPHGSIMGSTLFISFVNEMPHLVSPIVLVYVDDTKVSKQVNCAEASKILRTDQDCLSAWSVKRQLGFNVEKCKAMHLEIENQIFNHHTQKEVNS